MNEVPDLDIDLTDIPEASEEFLLVTPGTLPRYVVFDVETSGLTDNTLPAEHPSQPRLAHLAMVCLDHNLEITRQEDLYARCDGWTMPDELLEINGLTTRFLLDHGRPIGQLLDLYEEAILDGYVMVAYNAQFDLKIMRGELRRGGRPDYFEQTPNICLMRAFKEWRKIFKGYKLTDACTYLGIDYVRHHRAPADALAAVEVFRKLRERGASIPDPQVHYHRDHAAIVARGISGD